MQTEQGFFWRFLSAWVVCQSNGECFFIYIFFNEYRWVLLICLCICIFGGSALDDFTHACIFLLLMYKLIFRCFDCSVCIYISWRFCTWRVYILYVQAFSTVTVACKSIGHLSSCWKDRIWYISSYYLMVLCFSMRLFYQLVGNHLQVPGYCSWGVTTANVSETLRKAYRAKTRLFLFAAMHH